MDAPPAALNWYDNDDKIPGMGLPSQRHAGIIGLNSVIGAKGDYTRTVATSYPLPGLADCTQPLNG